MNILTWINLIIIGLWLYFEFAMLVGRAIGRNGTIDTWEKDGDD